MGPCPGTFTCLSMEVTEDCWTGAICLSGVGVGELHMELLAVWQFQWLISVLTPIPRSHHYCPQLKKHVNISQVMHWYCGLDPEINGLNIMAPPDFPCHFVLFAVTSYWNMFQLIFVLAWCATCMHTVLHMPAVCVGWFGSGNCLWLLTSDTFASCAWLLTQGSTCIGQTLENCTCLLQTQTHHIYSM